MEPRTALGILLSAFAVAWAAYPVAHMSALQAAEPWELTSEESAPRRALVGVHSEQREDIELGERALRASGPLDGTVGRP